MQSNNVSVHSIVSLHMSNVLWVLFIPNNSMIVKKNRYYTSLQFSFDYFFLIFLFCIWLWKTWLFKVGIILVLKTTEVRWLGSSCWFFDPNLFHHWKTWSFFCPWKDRSVWCHKELFLCIVLVQFILIVKRQIVLFNSSLLIASFLIKATVQNYWMIIKLFREC